MSPTPILDGDQPLPIRKTRWALGLLLGVALGGLLIALDRVRGSPDPLIPLQGFPVFVLALYIAIFVHELGHLIAGITADFELRTFMVGAFLFSKEASGWRFRFVLRNLFWGGLTGGIPRSAENLVNRDIRMIMGGPAASLVLLVITFVLPAGLTTRVLFWVNLIFTISVCFHIPEFACRMTQSSFSCSDEKTRLGIGSSQFSICSSWTLKGSAPLIGRTIMLKSWPYRPKTYPGCPRLLACCLSMPWRRKMPLG
jgi:hypothetical protein